MCSDTIATITTKSLMNKWYIDNYIDQLLCRAALWINGHSTSSSKKFLLKRLIENHESIRVWKNS